MLRTLVDNEAFSKLVTNAKNYTINDDKYDSKG